MKKPTRLFVLGAAGILVLGLGTGLVASYMGLQRFAVVGSDGPAELAYVPRDAHWVAFANVREVMDSELRQKIREFHGGANGGQERFKAETGIDLESDIDYVIATASALPSAGSEGRPLLLARGRFDQTRIEGVLREHGGSAQDYKGKRVLSLSSEQMGLAFLEPDLAAVGTPAAVRLAIDTKAGGGNVTANAELMGLVRDIDDGNAWAVARLDTLTSGSNVPPEIVSRLPPITWFAASGHVNGGIRGSVRAEARDATSAQDLREVIRGFMALARMQMGQQTGFADMLDSVQLTGQGNSVALTFSVPPEMIDALGALSAQRRQNAPRTPRVPTPGTPAL